MRKPNLIQNKVKKSNFYFHSRHETLWCVTLRQNQHILFLYSHHILFGIVFDFECEPQCVVWPGTGYSAQWAACMRCIYQCKLYDHLDLSLPFSLVSSVFISFHPVFCVIWQKQFFDMFRIPFLTSFIEIFRCSCSVWYIFKPNLWIMHLNNWIYRLAQHLLWNTFGDDRFWQAVTHVTETISILSS